MVYHGPFINGWFGGTPILGNHHLATQVYAVVPEEMLPSYSCMVLYPYSLLGDRRSYWNFPNGMINYGFGVLAARKWRGQQQQWQSIFCKWLWPGSGTIAAGTLECWNMAIQASNMKKKNMKKNRVRVAASLGWRDPYPCWSKCHFFLVNFSCFGILGETFWPFWPAEGSYHLTTSNMA